MLVKNVEKKIGDVEGFDVVIRHPGGADVKGNRSDMPTYPYERMAKGSMTVSGWKEQRFGPRYPGFDVDVLDGNGSPVVGNTQLSTVRDAYLEE
jgi:hypothetical protein